MSGADNAEADAETVAAVVDALKKLRGGHGVLTVQKFSHQPTLVQLLGDGDLFDGFIAFKRELGRLQRGNKFEAAVAYSIAADYESVLDRLQATAEALADGEPRDQRTARHWSDRGMEAVARELIAFAHLRGHLGRDLIGIALHDGGTGAVDIRIVQVASIHLRPRAPVVTVVQQPDSEHPMTNEIDLGQIHPDSRAVDGDLVTTAHTIRVALPNEGLDRERLAVVSVMARGSPTPTYFLESADLHSARSTFAVHRGLAVVELMSASRKSTLERPGDGRRAS
ncbi:hypothetical protein [Mycolicibacterium sp.]|uniref:hypothetical protein n=1 Tax=Mycolicibacterium sp. TaxID=2320850 RepID=UPI0037CC2B3E